MKPTVGRIVHYFPGEAETRGQDSSPNKGQPYPAVITHVWSDTCVNLHVLGDGSFGSPPATPTSISMRTAEGQTSVWDWPPKV